MLVRTTLRTQLAVLFSALALGLASVAHAVPRILVVGDSWAAGGYPRFAGVLASHGQGDKSAVGIGVPGNTAALQNTPGALQLITNALAANPTIDIVHLSIGGNDVLGGWNVSLNPQQAAALFAGIQANVQGIVNHILGLRPDLQVVITSYDYVNLFDTVLADPLGPPGILWAALGQPTPGQINRAFFGNQGCGGPGGTDGLEDFKRAVANGSSRVHYSDIEGRFQIAASGFCNLDLPTPTSFLAGGGTDPIHPNNAGYDLWVQAAYATAYAGLFNGPALWVPSSQLDYGLVRVGAQKSRTLSAGNLGPVGSHLDVSFGAAGAPFSGGGFGAHLFVEQATGAGDSVQASYVLAPTARGVYAQNVTVTSNDGNANASLSGQGVGPVAETSAAALDFGAPFLATSVNRTVTVSNTTDDPNNGNGLLTRLTLVDMEITGPDASAFEVTSALPVVVPKGGSAPLEIRFRAKVPAGPKSATLHIETDQGAPVGGAGTVLLVALGGQAVALSCGLSVELAAVLPLLLWLRRRRARA